MKRLLVILIVFSIQFVHAQDQDLKLAKKYFERTYYAEAIPLYEAAAEENRSLEIVRNLADSYYYTNDLAHAERWYRILLGSFSQNLDEEYYFRYIHTLKASGNYELANTVAREYLEKNKNSDGVAALDEAIETLDNISGIGDRFEIKNLSLNTPTAEFGAMKNGENLVFSGVKINSGKKVYKWNDEYYLDLNVISLAAVKSGDSIARGFSDEINSNLHEGNAIFTKDGKTMYFTRNNSKDGKREANKDKVSNLKLFRAELINGKWANIKPLPFNNDDYSVEHPALSADEKTLYFASDMPGSLGSFDIYSVAVNGGAFEVPKNLGAQINTIKKEQFPFISADGKLYFSSNGHFGFGSLDVFVSEMKNGTFSTPLNVGFPVNSGYDDFAFNIESATKEGYFASNRPGGQGSDDIYSLKETKPLIVEGCKQSIAGTITDIDTKLPLEKALVILQDINKKELERVVTDVTGQFSFKAECSQRYLVVASKEHYSNESRSFSLKKERNKTNDASMALKSAEAVKREQEAAAKKEKEVADARKKERIAEILSKEKDVVRDKGRLIIKTDPIYFDYDLWYIRKESKPILNRVIDLMNKYPDMVVEIGSHTDVRGNNGYNLDLSSKRAASTREYFIDKGIPEKRILSKGYGETVIIVRCVPEHSCNEEQHELNRRSEFVIKDL
ncbi:MAG TPA: OmpA family protein [Flavobacterium sp.]|jgi:outer membrane protein OmpA-like peptidoglycan-associated protein